MYPPNSLLLLKASSSFGVKEGIFTGFLCLIIPKGLIILRVQEISFLPHKYLSAQTGIQGPSVMKAAGVQYSDPASVQSHHSRQSNA